MTASVNLRGVFQWLVMGRLETHAGHAERAQSADVPAIWWGQAKRPRDAYWELCSGIGRDLTLQDRQTLGD
jgi:hypothetical protein